MIIDVPKRANAPISFQYNLKFFTAIDQTIKIICKTIEYVIDTTPNFPAVQTLINVEMKIVKTNNLHPTTFFDLSDINIHIANNIIKIVPTFIYISS